MNLKFSESPAFSERVLAWYATHGRKDLPWQHPCTPYRVWVSEIMLQQTQVSTVIPYFLRFIERFPSIKHLADASLDEVMQYWSGLGYYARARNLHKSARTIVQEHAGEFPMTIEDVINLPGIGRSTAGAILSLALNQRQPILDGNVKRVLCRHAGVRGWPGESRILKQLWQLAEERTPAYPCPEFTQAMMDLGAMVCKRGQPSCANCPISSDCVACQTHSQDQLPTARPRKTIPIRHTVMLIIQTDSGEVLLERRPPTGIWGGLLSLPELASTDNPAEWCLQRLGVTIESQTEWPVIEHKFSHFQLNIRPVLAKWAGSRFEIRESDRFTWQSPEYPGGGLPAPVNYLLNQLATLNTGAKNGTHG